MARPKNLTTGFTLIELLIVVVILSTLAAIVVPQFASSSDSAKIAAAKSSLNGIRSAMEIYRTDNGAYPLEEDYTVCAGLTQETGSNADVSGQLHQLLSLYNNGNNEVCNTSDEHPNGPYLRAREFPNNPLDNNKTVTKVDTNALGLTADSADTNGWKYQPATGEFIINDTDYENE